MIEAHPIKPDLSPWSGTSWQDRFSSYRQARTYGERVRYARNVSSDGVFDEVLVDTLQDVEPPKYPITSATTAARMQAAATLVNNNEVWCRWGPAPNSAWLIARNGTVLNAQYWFDMKEMDSYMARL